LNYQIYLSSIIYLLVGAAILLVDQYGGRYLLLLRLKNFAISSVQTSVGFVVIGVLLTIFKIAFPIPPGPPLLGDLIPSLALFSLSLYHFTLLFRQKRSVKGVRTPHQEVFQKTGSLIETHKKNLGFTILVIAALHFLFPQAILL
jgi:hypothetical protein